MARSTLARAQQRKKHPAKWLQWKMYCAEHRRCGKEKRAYPPLSLVNTILQRYHGQSVIPHNDDSNTLCVVRYYPHLPLLQYPWNAVLLTSYQARKLPRKREERARYFPVGLQREMENKCKTQKKNEK
jgi:hypothetical protein